MPVHSGGDWIVSVNFLVLGRYSYPYLHLPIPATHRSDR